MNERRAIMKNKFTSILAYAAAVLPPVLCLILRFIWASFTPITRENFEKRDILVRMISSALSHLYPISAVILGGLLLMGLISLRKTALLSLSSVSLYCLSDMLAANYFYSGSISINGWIWTATSIILEYKCATILLGLILLWSIYNKKPVAALFSGAVLVLTAIVMPLGLVLPSGWQELSSWIYTASPALMFTSLSIIILTEK